ncbi:PREDICTED: serine protease HTRA2, mitochondrial-like [Amphimedon queenslandica]|uniref:Uncharacterized protein n=1 Tax=Amphimedon queenslandica TaxID=400682 RepID=A0AAN0J632_AMPQE|nr:PREDICTED: serine protease HTRA2, mitochondrial-like [Amphimedon queenslandica]|eukprot:XP_019852479.1 PREDICTED: serine protease HTRA2, mitochondrial-like [Amphimedon queenslandica]
MATCTVRAMAFLMRRSIPRDVLIQRAIVRTLGEERYFKLQAVKLQNQTIEEQPGRQRSSDKYNFIADTVEKVSPCICSVDIQTVAKQDELDFFSRDSPGFIVNGGQYVLFIVPWAAHGLAVCSDQSVTVRLHNDRTLTGTVTATDRAADLALVKLHLPKGSKPLPSLEFASRLRPGEWVIAFGLPFAQIAFSPGIVMDVRAHIIDQEYVLTNAAIPTYFHGSVFVNLDGEVIGVNVMEDHSCEYTLGMSFAIPSDFAKKFLKRAMKETSSSSKRKRKGFIMIHT